MTELCRGKTTLVIAHKLPTIRNADRIAVVGDGQVLECGSHDELMALDGVYRRMVHAGERACGWDVAPVQGGAQPDDSHCGDGRGEEARR